jgi:hypothetical protein
MTKIVKIAFGLFFTLNLLSCTVEDDPLNPADDRDAFLGNWNVIETCNKDGYTVNITIDPSNSSQVIIENFALIGYNEKPPYAIIAGSTITIPKQLVCDDESLEVAGSGKLDKETIKLDYTLSDGADLVTCTANFEKP